MAVTSNAKSAKNGTVSWKGTAVVDATDLIVNKSVKVNEYASSGTDGKIGRTVGHSDASGSFTALTDDTTLFVEGENGMLLMKSDSSNTLYNGMAVIISANYKVPIGEGGNCEVDVSWGAAPNLAS